jgi:hypothetical protein
MANSKPEGTFARLMASVAPAEATSKAASSCAPDPETSHRQAPRPHQENPRPPFGMPLPKRKRSLI